MPSALLAPSKFSVLKRRVTALKTQAPTIGARRRILTIENYTKSKLWEKLTQEERRLVKDILHPDVHDAWRAIEKLYNIKSKKTLPILRALLKDKNPHIRQEAVFAVSILGNHKDLPALSRAMYDKEDRVSSTAIHIFGMISQTHPQALPFLLKRATTPSDLGTIKSLKLALALQPSIGSDFQLYSGLEKEPKFTDPTKRVVRSNQMKDGGKSTLLGGKLFKKVRIVVISKENFEAWKKAQEAGIPVEPILTKNGKLRVHKNPDGTYRVSSGIIEGEPASIFIQKKQNKKWFELLINQASEIKQKLLDNKIHHGHIHSTNIVIRMENGKPKSYLIDFDEARIIE